MTRAIPCLGYPSKTAAIKGLRGQGMTDDEIAEATGLPLVTVRITRYKENVAKRRSKHRHIQVPAEVGDHLHREAYKRGISTLRLIAKLLECIAKDEMVTSILDDNPD